MSKEINLFLKNNIYHNIYYDIITSWIMRNWGRTAIELSTLLLFKLPGLSEPLTFQTFELEPFQLLGERAQPQEHESPVTL